MYAFRYAQAGAKWVEREVSLPLRQNYSSFWSRLWILHFCLTIFMGGYLLSWYRSDPCLEDFAHVNYVALQVQIPSATDGWGTLEPTACWGRYSTFETCEQYYYDLYAPTYRNPLQCVISEADGPVLHSLLKDAGINVRSFVLSDIKTSAQRGLRWCLSPGLCPDQVGLAKVHAALRKECNVEDDSWRLLLIKSREGEERWGILSLIKMES